MICLMIYILICCQSTNTYFLENNGAKIELANKRGSYIDSVDNRTYDRTNNNYKEKEFKEEIKFGEVRKMEGLNELLTVIGSAIAGVYCAVKAIYSFIKKIKK